MILSCHKCLVHFSGNDSKNYYTWQKMTNCVALYQPYVNGVTCVVVSKQSGECEHLRVNIECDFQSSELLLSLRLSVVGFLMDRNKVPWIGEFWTGIDNF